MASSQCSQTQYHHFIPQFILKKFSHEYEPPVTSKSARRRLNKKTNLRPGDPLLHIIDLKPEVPQLSESPVRRTFGFLDMYRDSSNPSDYNVLEKEIGKIENRAAKLISEIKKAFDAGNVGFSMPRQQRDLLRKFMFIMKYRGPSFYKRFNTEEYKQDDIEQFKRYMRENGYKKPVDVWIKSIKTTLDLTIDVDGKWREELITKIYHDDAMWFIMHMESYFLAFCTSAEPDAEFILTENCYNVYEGPSGKLWNTKTEEYEFGEWTSYHEFSPITPKLMLVLRSVLLPNAREDIREDIRLSRERLHEAVRRGQLDPRAGSKLEDLPLEKPYNSYSEVLPEGIQLLPGEDGSRRSHHQFTFPFFKITKDQIRRINAIFLENAHLTSGIAFRSKSSLKMSLEHYLRLPEEHGFKVITREDNNPQLIYLKKLELVARSMGSNAALVYKEAPGRKDLRELKARSKDLREKFQNLDKDISQQPSEYMQLYQKLGGNYSTMRTDLDQVRTMRWFRIKIDVHTQGYPEFMRENVRRNLRDIFCQNIPTRRIWYYIKSLRMMSLGSPGDMNNDRFVEGPEDVIVKISHIDIEHRRYPGLNPSSHFDLDAAGREKFSKIHHLAFAPVGSIRNCRIKQIQALAVKISHTLQSTEAYNLCRDPRWSVEENIELQTRFIICGELDSLLSKDMPRDTLEELKDVLFNIVYPTYTTA